MKNFFNKIKQTLEMIKFSHSLFALPFALSAFFVASNGLPNFTLFVLVVLCMVLARNTAMSFNRLVDVKIDALNPRTSNRHLPSGILSKNFVISFIMMNAICFLVVSYFINPLAFKLAPLALGIICFYSLTKRFTHLTQIFLGIALGISPIAAWIAATGDFNKIPIILGLAVLFWVSGFDIIYSTQDYHFDKENKIYSLVSFLGIKKALYLARFFHGLCLLFFFCFAYLIDASFVLYATLLLMAVFLIYEHKLVKFDDLSKVNAAFFTMNGIIGMLFLGGVLIEVFFIN